MGIELWFLVKWGGAEFSLKMAQMFTAVFQLPDLGGPFYHKEIHGKIMFPAFSWGSIRNVLPGMNFPPSSHGLLGERPEETRTIFVRMAPRSPAFCARGKNCKNQAATIDRMLWGGAAEGPCITASLTGRRSE